VGLGLFSVNSTVGELYLGVAEELRIYLVLERTIAWLLQALRNKDIVHRDLKPQNILLTKDLRAKVSDMGLAKQIAPSATSFATTGASGSSGWQAPEQIKPSDDGGTAIRLSKAVDIFSLGLVIFWALSNGQHPFGVHTFERDANIVNSAPDLSALDALPDIQNLLEAMLDRCA
jgi:serine/threonine-protein kinase/endoribonuclease IRE1